MERMNPLDRAAKRAIWYAVLFTFAVGIALQALFSLVDPVWRAATNAGSPAAWLSLISEGKHLALVIILLLAAGLAIFSARRAVSWISGSELTVRALDIKEMEVPKHGAVIVALSRVENARGLKEELVAWLDGIVRANGQPENNAVADAMNKLDRFCTERRPAGRENVAWQHITRTWRHHMVPRDDGRLWMPPLYVLTSGKDKSGEGSEKDFGDFKDFCGKLLGPLAAEGNPPVCEVGPGIDFEDYNIVKSKLETAYDQAKERIMRCNALLPAGVRAEPIIDVTGGQRPFAVAASGLTLRKVSEGFSYVSQSDPDKKLKYYVLVGYKPQSTGAV